MSTLDEPWYSVRTVHEWASDGSARQYEERITLWRAASFDEAIAKAELEAIEYARSNGHTYTGFIEAFHLFDESIREGTEVFSLLRNSALDPTDYIDHHFDSASRK